MDCLSLSHQTKARSMDFSIGIDSQRYWPKPWAASWAATWCKEPYPHYHSILYYQVIVFAIFEASQKASHNCISLILMKCITGIYTSLNAVEETFPYDAVKDLQIIPPSTINIRERKREMRFKKLHIKGTVILGKIQESHQWRVQTKSPRITS